MTYKKSYLSKKIRKLLSKLDDYVLKFSKYNINKNNFLNFFLVGGGAVL